MFLRNQFPPNGTFEMPQIHREELNLENVKFIGYDKLNDKCYDHIVHFFLDDCKFQVLWNDPFD